MNEVSDTKYMSIFLVVLIVGDTHLLKPNVLALWVMSTSKLQHTYTSKPFS